MADVSTLRSGLSPALLNNTVLYTLVAIPLTAYDCQAPRQEKKKCLHHRLDRPRTTYLRSMY